MFKDLRSNGYDILIVEKAYDDGLQAYISGEIKKNMIRYNSLDVCIIDGF
jgi:hypothetical protein